MIHSIFISSQSVVSKMRTLAQYFVLFIDFFLSLITWDFQLFFMRLLINDFELILQFTKNFYSKNLFSTERKMETLFNVIKINERKESLYTSQTITKLVLKLRAISICANRIYDVYLCLSVYCWLKLYSRKCFCFKYEILLKR